jgi:hypothetical protein
MLIERTDPALWERFEALSREASVRIHKDADGWQVLVRPRDGSAPFECVRPELLDAVVWVVNHAAAWSPSVSR